MLHIILANSIALAISLNGDVALHHRSDCFEMFINFKMSSNV